MLHPWQEVLGPVDRLSEALEAGAVPEKLRAHGEDGVQPGRRLACEASQELDEARGLGMTTLGVAEQLLELVDQDADVIVLALSQQRGDGFRRVAAAVQQLAEVGGERRVRVTAAVDAGEGFCQIAERILAGQHRPGSPPTAGRRVPLLELDQNPGPNERGLAAAGVAVHDDHLVLDHQVDDPVGHRLTPEEDRPLVALERAQTGIGPGRQAGVEGTAEPRRGG